MASFHIPQLKPFLPILKECYGFDRIEIASELAESISPHINERKMDQLVWEQLTKGKGRIVLLDYAISVNENVEICTTDDFDKQISSIENLCDQSIEDENMRDIAKFILIFMAAIFNRDINSLQADDVMKRMLINKDIVHPDLLRLFIALNKPKHKHDTPMKICFKTDSPHSINNGNGWFSDMLNGFVKQMLGDITVEMAEQELKTKYSDDKGRKSNNPYLNYIINGTYNFIKHFIPSDTVTVEQCKFLLVYLKAIDQVNKGDTLDNLNTLQSAVKSLISSKQTPVEKHEKRKGIYPFNKISL